MFLTRTEIPTLRFVFSFWPFYRIKAQFLFFMCSPEAPQKELKILRQGQTPLHCYVALSTSDKKRPNHPQLFQHQVHCPDGRFRQVGVGRETTTPIHCTDWHWCLRQVSIGRDHNCAGWHVRKRVNRTYLLRTHRILGTHTWCIIYRATSSRYVPHAPFDHCILGKRHNAFINTVRSRAD